MAYTHSVYCANCGPSLLSTFKKCPSCGGREFSDSPVTPTTQQETLPPSPSRISIPTPAPSDGGGQDSLVEQPNHRVGQFAYAGFWIRAGAYAIDTMIMLVALIPFQLIWGIGGWWWGNEMRTGVWKIGGLVGVNEMRTVGETFFLDILIPTILWWVYSALMESSEWQATLGNRAFGLKVVGAEGQRINFGRATGRHFAKYISSILLLVGFIMVGFTKKKQGLHDMMASTFVYRT